MYLEFDKRQVFKYEIIENINFYISESSKGLKYISEKNNKEAMKTLKKLKKSLKNECNYYSNPNVYKFIKSNDINRIYFFGIKLAYSKLYKTYSYKYLYDNLFNIWDSISNNDMCLFLKDIKYLEKNMIKD
ncbi:hypothetical protein [Romboutsia sp. MSSM.1001216sp_RTP31141st1_G3_RTP31141_220114]|uniref:hypothetical protein n=1 Tax=unclassified Romboutsia TaxID=2626894 RepID=UPI0031B58932